MTNNTGMQQIGRYLVERELGRGAMGIVLHANDPKIGRPVAIKMIRVGEMANPEERKKLQDRLLREAKSAGQLSHPGIVTIYDVEEKDDLTYIAMEFVEGPTLDQLLSAEKPIEPEYMMSILRQTASALDYAHQKGIIHRDIKPANIMLAEGGTAKITDFGIAKLATSEQFTMTGTILGTPNYMSPEQVQGHAIDGRTDQFSLAVVAYEMLTGERPFGGEHLTTVVYKIVCEEPLSPDRLNPTLGPQIGEVLRKGLAKKPEDRYATCSEFVQALEEACAATSGWKGLGRGESLTVPTMMSESRPELRAHAAPVASSAKAADKSKKLLVAAAAIAAIGFVGIIAWQAGSRSGSKALPPAATSKKQAAAEAKPKTETGPPETEAKPSPMAMTAPGPERPSAGKPDEALPTSRAPATLRTIRVTTDPAGASVVLDNLPGTECTSPCFVKASPGGHTLSVTLDGYQTETREVRVGARNQEVSSVIVLRKRSNFLGRLFKKGSGTLMLSSTPPGAFIYVNDKLMAERTPAQLSLPKGKHKVSIEKDGRKAAGKVEIKDGVTSYLKLSLSE